MWLCPTHIQNRITEVSGGRGEAAPRAASRSGSVRPPRARAPARRKVRRLIGPGQRDFLMVAPELGMNDTPLFYRPGTPVARCDRVVPPLAGQCNPGKRNAHQPDAPA